MTGPSVSVIVVSRNRPDALVRCVTGLEQLDYGPFEVIVVADPGGIASLDAAGFAGLLTAIPFDTPNISAARNQGLAAARGQVVAFVDDDAVPEPTWLTHLTGPMRDPEVAAAGGYVIGRNGISFQHRARRVDALGRHEPIAMSGDAPQVFGTRPGAAIKTEGTNCAFRADVLRALGGFDPAYRFYLDETDVNLRLAVSGARTAIVPLAQVHHGFAASDRRLANRVPTTLHEIGASQAVFLRRHAPESLAAGLDDLRAEQRRRLLRFMVAGLCDPRDVGRLLATLDAGISEGTVRDLTSPAPVQATGGAFHRFEGRSRFEGSAMLFGRPSDAQRLRQKARALTGTGRRTTLFLFDRTPRYHSARFRADGGFWEQTGGQYGRSLRDQPLMRRISLMDRVAAESARLTGVRGPLPPVK